MTGDVIKQFLVGLGFGVDDGSLSKFNKAIQSATLKVTALYAATNLMAAAIVKGISGISESFEEMGYEYRIIAPAINKALVLRNELLKAYSAAGVNIQKVIVASVKLNMSLAKTKFAMQAIYQSVASRFFGLLTKQSDIFRSKLYQYMPQIQNLLERFVKAVFKAVEIVTRFATVLWSILTRVYDFFVSLDRATDGWSSIVLGLIAAWKFLNLSFLATPLGMLLAGFAALIALWDDFKTFREGGQSLINWGSDTVKVIVAIGTVIASLAAGIMIAVAAFKAWAVVQGIINALLLLNPIGLWITGITALIALITALALKMGWLKGGIIASFGEGVMNMIGGGNAATNLQNNPVGKPLANPAGNVQNAQTNQNVSQQTQINVMGSADANATASAVAGSQGRVNYDMTRNLKGATR